MIGPQLVSEIELIHLIYTKYRAQQRTQKWWKYLAILHRRLLRMVQKNKVDATSAAFIALKLTPKAARAFHSILAQGAFIGLGFALIAALARVRTLLEPHIDRRCLRSNENKKYPTALQEFITDEDIGEALEDNKISVRTSHESSKQDKLKKKKKKKKGASSAIDDIFG